VLDFRVKGDFVKLRLERVKLLLSGNRIFPDDSFTLLSGKGRKGKGGEWW